MAEAERARLRALARFLIGWGELAGLGLDEPALLDLLALEADAPDLRALATRGAGALRAGGGDFAAAVEAADELPFWVQLLLAAPRRATALAEAGALLTHEAERGWDPGLPWRRLRLLHLAGAPPGDALGALAREARDHGRGALGEALYAAARRARDGASLGEALRGARGLPALEAFALSGAAPERPLEDVLAAVARIAAAELERHEEAGREPAPASGSLETLAEAASERVRPLRRGLERLVSNLEGALGVGRPTPREELLREAARAQQERARRGEEGSSDGASGAAPTSAAAPPSAPPARAGKTIGADSGPLRVSEVEAAAAAAWTRAYDDARATLTILEVQPEERALAGELEAALGALREQLARFHSPERARKLAELEERARRLGGPR